MVRDLVVIDEVGVDDRGAAVQLLDDERRAEVPKDDVRRRAREGIGMAAISARLDAANALALRLDDLLHDLSDRKDEPAQVGVRADEEPVEDVAAARLARRIVNRRRGQVAALGVAGEQVADRRAADQQAASVGEAPHDLARVGRMVRDEEVPAVLLPPAERGDAVVRAMEDPGLAGRGLRRQERLPLVQHHPARSEPPRERGHPAALELADQDRIRQAVDLDEHDAGVA